MVVSGSVIGTFGDMCVCSGENGGICVECADKWRCLCEREETRARSGVKGQDGRGGGVSGPFRLTIARCEAEEQATPRGNHAGSPGEVVVTTAEAEAALRANQNPVVRAITLGVCWAADRTGR